MLLKTNMGPSPLGVGLMLRTDSSPMTIREVATCVVHANFDPLEHFLKKERLNTELLRTILFMN